MEELVFFAVIIAMSVLDSIARSRKAKRAQNAEGGVPAESGAGEARWEGRGDTLGGYEEPGGSLATYDDEPSYDDEESYDDRLEWKEESEGRDPSPSSPAESRPSTEMLGGDLLEQLAELAGGRLKGRMEQAQERLPTVRVPRQSPPLPRPTRPSYDVLLRGEEHLVHRAHAGYGTDPSERAPSEQDGLDPLAQKLGADAEAVRRQLLDHDTHALRQALVLQEILGPPAALSGRRFYDDD